MENKMDIEEKAKELAAQESAEKENEAQTVTAEVITDPKNVALTNEDKKFGVLTNYQENSSEENALVSTLMDTSEAVKIAKGEFANLKNQKNIAKKMNKVVNEKTNADIDSAHLQVEDQKVDNKIKRAEQRNRLIQLNAEKKFLEREAKHKLKMQKFKQIKEKNYDLLLKYYRAKHKDESGKWVYESDAEGNPIIHMPSSFNLHCVRFFDAMTSTLNQIAEAVGGLNKVVFKGGLIILILIFIFIPPFRSWILKLIKFW